MTSWKYDTKQNGMVPGVLNNKEQKMDFKCNAEWDEKLVAEETGIKCGIEYGLEQDTKWKTEEDGY